MRKLIPKSLLLLMGVTVIFTFCADNSAGQKPPGSPEVPAALPVIELEEYFALVEEEMPPVTTGVSRPLQKEKVPASITVITAEEIKCLGLRHLTDVINYIVPGGVADIHRSQRTGLYAFRGVTVDNNGKYVFMVDGLNCSELNTWGAFNERYLGLLDELDRIEIIQGTGSILYGSGAISGIINFITKTGKSFQGTELTAGYGHWDKVETSAKYGKKVSAEEDYFCYVGYKHSQGSTPRDGAGQQRDESSAPGRYWDHFAPSGKFQANINRGDFSLRMRFVEDKFEEPYTHVNPVTDLPRVLNTSDTYWYLNYLFIEPEIRKELSETSRMKASLAFGMDEWGREKIDDWYRSGRVVVRQDEDLWTTGSRKLRGRFFHYNNAFPQHKLTTGAEIFWMSIGRNFKGENLQIDRNAVQTQKIAPEEYSFAAVFLEDIWQAGERTILFLGARLEDHTKTRASFSPRIALSHTPSEKINWKLLYNYGFRTPDWVYYSRNNEVATADTPDPEKVHSFEGHLAYKFNSAFKSSFVAYYTIYKELINYYVDSTTTPSIDYGYYNFPDVRAAGLEMLGEYQKKNLKLKFSHSFSRPVHLSANNYEIVDLSFDRRNWAQFPTHMTKAQALFRFNGWCTLGFTYFRPWGIFGHQAPDPDLKDLADYLNTTLTAKMRDDLEIQVSIYNLLSEDHPWWGNATRNGVSRSIDPHTECFLRVTYKF